METILISRNRKIQGKNGKRYTLATTFGDAPVIIFWRSPKNKHLMIERCMGQILEHETLHIVMHKTVPNLDLDGFDRLFCFVTSFTRRCNKIGKKPI